MNIFIKVTMLFLLIIPSFAYAGTPYYVDPSQTDPFENGSFEHPWNSILDVNSHRFNDGDDIYFKVNTYIKTPVKLSITWNGTKNDRVIIGAYSGENNFTLNNNSRPIFDGGFSVPGVDSGLIEYKHGEGYVTIQDISVKNVSGIGICIDGWVSPGGHTSIYNTVKNCYIENTTYQGILLARTSYSSALNNVIIRASYQRAPGAGLEITGGNDETVSHHNTASGNTVSWCFEGIGAYLGTRYATIENNVVFDCRSYHLYSANSRDIIIRNNIAYETQNQLDGDDRDLLIGVDAEGHIPGFIDVTGHTEITGNYLAGGSCGISLISNSNDIGLFQSYNIVSDNVIVDCDYNFSFRKNTSGWEGNVFKNNVSQIFTPGMKHIDNDSPYGVTWETNFFNTSVSGEASKSADYLTVLSKTSDWRSLPAGAVNISFFNFTKEGQSTYYSINEPNALETQSQIDSPVNLRIIAP